MLRIATLTTWLCSISMGFVLLANYSTKPGEVSEPISSWPENAQISFRPGKSNLVVFLHPKCPCSTATLRQLEKLGLESSSIQLSLVYYLPNSEEKSWCNTQIGNWSFEGATKTFDRDGLEARRFHVTTSGHVLLFHSSGELAFSGGITAGRGHEGNSPSFQALKKVLEGDDRSSEASTFDVYGCPFSSQGLTP